MMKRLLEFFKSLLILALIASAFFLTYQAWSMSIGTSGNLDALFRGGEPEVPDSYTEYEEYSSVLTLLTPIQAIVRNEEGLCTLPDAGSAVALFERTRTTLQEALTTAKDTERIALSQWKDALNRTMVLYNFEAAVPLDCISVISTGLEASFPDVVRLILEASDSGMVTLYFEDVYGAYLRCETDTSASSLYAMLLDYTPDGSVFLFEINASADSFVTTLPRTGVVLEKTTVLTHSLSTDSNRMIANVLEAYGFNSYTTKAYPETNTTRVYVEELNTMRLSDDGTVRFYAPEMDTGERTEPGSFQKAGILADAFDICRQAFGNSLSDAQIYLIKTYTDKETGRFVVLFGAHVDGVPIVTQPGYIASFEYCGSQLAVSDCYLHGYSKSEISDPLLPAEQAYASLTGWGDLALRYVEEDGRYVLDWYEIGE